MRLQYQLLPLFDAMISLGEFPEGFRAGARSRGWNLGLGRVPVSEDQKQQIVAMQNRIDHLVAGVAGITGDLASVTSGASKQVDSRQSDPRVAIDEIVRRVLAQLKG
jgi:4-hydroxy-tetrahydrodipicolinate synthase